MCKKVSNRLTTYILLHIYVIAIIFQDSVPAALELCIIAVWVKPPWETPNAKMKMWKKCRKYLIKGYDP